MVPVTKTYRFTGPAGEVTLADLFSGHSQLIVYHFMFGPDETEGCNACSVMGDSTAPVEHLRSRDTAFVFASRAPVAKLEAFRARMGWSTPWYSTLGSDFNYDYHVTQDAAVAPVQYNFEDAESLEKKGKPWFARGEQPGASVFFRDGDAIYHTYSTYMRGLDQMLAPYNWLDLTPKGRQDGGTGCCWLLESRQVLIGG